MDKVFGIDLGTTYSCIAYVDEYDKAVVIQNFENERTTPSVVYFEDDGSIIVGQEAKSMLKTDPEKVVTFIKRSMGDPNFFLKRGKIQYTPEEISNYILKKLVKDASDKVGFEIKDVVITCPAYFGVNQREATKIAGEIAGLNVKSIINEPTAAALAYGIEHVQHQTVLVYDLGGGTFDVTMIEVKPQSIEVVVTGGDHNLGGKNWDDALMLYCADKFKEKKGVTDDILSNEETFGELQIEVENAKKTLSTRNETKIRVLYGTNRDSVEVSREKFNELTKDLAKRTIMLTNQMLDDAKVKGKSSFDKILLVGGSTRMPQIKAILEDNYPAVPVEFFDPDESVAKGAAIYGQQLAINGEIIKRLAEKTGKSEEEVVIKDVSATVLNQVHQEVADKIGFTLGAVKKATEQVISNVASQSFGIEAITKEGSVKVINLIMKQSNVPAEVTKIFGTNVANQDNVEVTVYENEMSDYEVDIEQSTELSKGIIDGLPRGLPAGSPVQVTFKLNNQGTLEVNAVELTGNCGLNLTIETTSVISGETLEEAKARSKAIKLS